MDLKSLTVIFESILTMSVTGSLIALPVILLWLFFKNKISKMLLLALWAIVFIKLAIPIDIPVPVSPWNQAQIEQTMDGILSSTTIPSINNPSIEAPPMPDPDVAKGIGIPNKPVNPLLFIYFVGLIASSLALALLYLPTSKKLSTATLVEGYITKFYISDKASSPLVFGIIKPKIILPHDFDLSSTQTLNHILIHEKQHIRNLDNLWNMLILFVLCLHWFNPIVWVARIMFNRDIESYCDYKVVKAIGDEHKKEYAYSLLSCAAHNKKLSPTLILGFGENDVSERIKGVMRFKSAGIIAGIITLLLIPVLVVFVMGAPNGIGPISERAMAKVIARWEGVPIEQVDFIYSTKYIYNNHLVIYYILYNTEDGEYHAKQQGLVAMKRGLLGWRINRAPSFATSNLTGSLDSLDLVHSISGGGDKMIIKGFILNNEADRLHVILANGNVLDVPIIKGGFVFYYDRYSDPLLPNSPYKMIFLDKKNKEIYIKSYEQDFIDYEIYIENDNQGLKRMRGYDADTGYRVFAVEDENFRIKTYINKLIFSVDEVIDIYSTIEYIGEEKSISIWSGGPYFHTTIYDGELFLDQAMTHYILMRTDLIKGEIYTIPFQKNGMYSDDDPNHRFWRQFMSEKDLKLPKGEYTFTSRTNFTLDKDQKNPLSLKTGFVVTVE